MAQIAISLKPTLASGGQSITLAGAKEVVITGLLEVLRGPQGIPGLTGPAGAGVRYEHTQNVAQTIWVVNHNLGYRPNTQVLSVGGAILIAENLHVSQNQVQIYFDVPTLGLALFS